MIKSMALIQKVENASREGMEMAVHELMYDALETTPECPRLTGALASSHSAFVNGKLVGVAPHYGGKATPLLFGVPRTSTQVEGTVVANKPYAAAQHEAHRRIAGRKALVKFKSYTSAKSGPKWLEIKLRNFGLKYFALIASRIL